jgi:uncharacterized DUF497 family protein
VDRLRFSWDEHKNLTNQRKHRVSFQVAARVFQDPNRIEQYDDRDEYGEDRWITVGIVGTPLLTVVYTVRDEDGEVIRLISARRANAQEARAYRHHEA